MPAKLESILAAVDAPAAAVRRASELEATAPKAGNVFPGQSFDDLTHDDFMLAARIAGERFSEVDKSVCQRALAAARETFAQVGSNVNLGILLLLAPLVDADESATIRAQDDWKPAIADALRGFDQQDSTMLLAAIRGVSAGGLGKVDEMDVHRVDGEHSADIVAAMRLARDRDRIALQYADGFVDLLDNVVPIVRESIVACQDISQGIADAHLRLLAATPDTLIARKCGLQTAQQVQKRAANVDLSDESSRLEFDAYLRTQGNKLNPGTTADLIAAALYVLLRTPND